MLRLPEFRLDQEETEATSPMTELDIMDMYAEMVTFDNVLSTTTTLEGMISLIGGHGINPVINDMISDVDALQLFDKPFMSCTVDEALEGIGSAIVDGIKKAWQAVVEFLKKVWKFITDMWKSVFGDKTPPLSKNEVEDTTKSANDAPPEVKMEIIVTANKKKADVADTVKRFQTRREAAKKQKITTDTKEKEMVSAEVVPPPVMELDLTPIPPEKPQLVPSKDTQLIDSDTWDMVANDVSGSIRCSSAYKHGLGDVNYLCNAVRNMSTRFIDLAEKGDKGPDVGANIRKVTGFANVLRYGTDPDSRLGKKFPPELKSPFFITITNDYQAGKVVSYKSGYNEVPVAPLAALEYPDKATFIGVWNQLRHAHENIDGAIQLLRTANAKLSKYYASFTDEELASSSEKRKLLSDLAQQQQNYGRIIADLSRFIGREYLQYQATVRAVTAKLKAINAKAKAA